ncbi:hypothetical protein AVEN_31230-1 [Araneus ventricosus]|uniref:Uncharacterized protein n=1 Tax=Araneus ventricosus TaxID=182803 RepID=A0A4Y2J2L8_ARAVE|nr:hypothetical protein AVEN_31230-1 [Araneus ventricosus]
MPFGHVNPIDSPYGQFVFNCTHPRKSLCSVAFGDIARGPRRLNRSKDRGSIVCEVNHVSLWEHGMHFLPRKPIQLIRNPLGSELGSVQWRYANVLFTSPLFW